MKDLKTSLLIVVTAALCGCAHPIVITPDVSKLERDTGVQPIPKSVGYYFTEAREKEVITAGGGGDKVSYKPYKDIEGGLYKVLSNVFQSVSSITSDKDPAVSQKQLGYVMAVEVSTNSSSPSLFTWPPTVFGVNLTANISDSAGKPVTRLLAIGEGRAEWAEFKGDFSLAGKRSSDDALKKLQAALFGAPELNPNIARATNYKTQNSSADNLKPPVQSKEDQLRALKKLHDDGLITKDVYLERQKIILAY